MAVASRIGEVDDLLPDEEALIARSVPARRAEFAAGRWCARAALAALGGPPSAIMRGPLFEPLWPVGFGGSLTHDGRLAVAVAYGRSAGEGPCVGIDLVDRPDPVRFLSVSRLVLCADDRLGLRGGSENGIEVGRAFSAKEAAIKILSAYAGRFIPFTEVVLRAEASGFVLRHPALGPTIRSRHRMVEDVLITVAETAE